VLPTADLDFGAILAAARTDRPSVVQLRSDNLDPGLIGEAFLVAVRQAGEELLGGALMSLDIERARLRILPLG
jgi:predicted nuclease of predicted toxin-antitoxin system